MLQYLTMIVCLHNSPSFFPLYSVYDVISAAPRKLLPTRLSFWILSWILNISDPCCIYRSTRCCGCGDFFGRMNESFKPRIWTELISGVWPSTTQFAWTGLWQSLPWNASDLDERGYYEISSGCKKREEQSDIWMATSVNESIDAMHMPAILRVMHCYPMYHRLSMSRWRACYRDTLSPPYTPRSQQ